MKTLLRPAARYLRENHCNVFYQVEKAWRWRDDLKRLRYPAVDSPVSLLEYAKSAGWPTTVHAPARLVERAPSLGISEDMELIGREWAKVIREGRNSPMYMMQLRSRIRYPVEAAFTTVIPEAHVGPTGDVIINDQGTPLRVRNWSERAHCEGIDEAEIVEGRAVSLLSVYATSFSHWVTDSLMRVAFLEPEARAGLRFLIPARRRGFIDDYLDVLGIEEDQRVYVSSWVFCEELVQIEAVHRSNLPHPAAVEAFRSLFHIPDQPGTKRIFIGRRTRKLHNEDAVFAVARDFGFERFFLEDLNLREQVALFNEAEYVTGYHGAGFTNILFSPSSTKIVEILNPAKWDHFYVRLANLLNQEHWHTLVQYRPHTWDASMDPGRWEKTLRLATGSTGAAETVY